MLDLTERHRDVVVTARGVSARGERMHAHSQVCACDAGTLRDALDARMPDDVSREVLHVGAHVADVYSTYPHSRSIYEATRQTGFLCVGDVVHRDGCELWHVVADAQELSGSVSLLREHAEVRVERVSESPPAAATPAGDLLDRLGERLTARQLEMLLAAVENGYYSWPRGASPTTLAASQGISAPTYLEHLRRAESRVLPEVVRELAARRLQEPANALAP